MKTQISKLFFVFGATLVYLGLFSPLNAQAQQTTFNTLSNDRPTIQVANYTNNPGCTSCWSNSVSAQPGDVIAVYIYYHNTGTATANSTTLKLNSSGSGFSSTNHTISGSVGASNANTVNGSATINLSQSESLVFDNYVKWYPNHQITNPSTIPFGQNINSVLTSAGINIGNIAPDAPLGSFSTQGSMVVHFRVTDTQVPPPPSQINCVIDDFTASPSVVNYGYYSNLNWNTTNCNNLVITGAGMTFSNLNPDGSKSTGALYNPTNTFTLTGYGDNGMVQMSRTVTVTGQPSGNCVVNTFSASPNNNIPYGESTTLYWTTTNCDDVDISNGVGDVPDDGSEYISHLYNDETYTITATGNNSSDAKTITVYVDDNGNNNDDCEIDEFYADPDDIEEGDNTTLYWKTTNCDDVSISNGIGNVSDDGHEDTDDLFEDETYTIYASDGNSSDAKTITVNVDDSNNNNDDDCEIDDFYASPSSVTYGDDTKLYWETTDCDDVYISNGVGNVDDDGDERIDNIYSTTTYTITAHGDNGSDSDSVTVYVNQAPIHESTSVTTLGVQNVGRTSADITGVLVYTGNQTTNVWFEYGTTTSLGNVTSQSSFYSSVNTPFTKSLSGLTPDTLYYFKAVGTNQSGRTEGIVRYFRTAGATTPVNTNTVVYVNSGTGESLLNLELTSSFENVGVGEQYDIDIAYENTSATVTAKDTTLTIVLPKNLVFQRISRGEYNLRDHTIFVDLEDVSPKEKGEITLQVRVGAKAENGELLVTIGTLNYEKNDKKEEVIDILTNKVTADGSVLGAFALGGGFLPTTLIGWLMLLIVFLVIIYLANKMFRKKNYVAQPMSVPVPPQTYR